MYNIRIGRIGNSNISLHGDCHRLIAAIQFNKFYSFTNDENKNTINYDRFSPKKSSNPLSVPKKVFQTKNLYTNQVENVLSQPNFEI